MMDCTSASAMLLSNHDSCVDVLCCVDVGLSTNVHFFFKLFQDFHLFDAHVLPAAACIHLIHITLTFIKITTLEIQNPNQRLIRLRHHKVK